MEIIAVNAFDDEARVSKYLSDGGFTFPVVMGGEGEKYTLGKAYGVQAYPTNYLIGPGRKILWRSVGFDEQGLRAALAAAGVK
jgi:hypothetical protein